MLCRIAMRGRLAGAVVVAVNALRSTHRARALATGAWVAAMWLAGSAVFAPAVRAQRVVVTVGPEGPFAQRYTQSWLADPWRLEWSEPWSLGGSGLFTSDGRYLVYPWPAATPTSLRVQDVLTRGIVELPLRFRPVRAHPQVPAVFGMLVDASFGWTAARLDPTGLHVAAGCAAGTARALDLSADGAVLVTLCTSGEVFVLDASSGAILRQVTGGASHEVLGLAAGVDASHVLVARAGPTLARGIARIDTVSGATLGVAAFPAPECTAPQLAASSPDRGRVLVTCWWSATPPGFPITITSSARLLDAVSLTWGAELGIPYVAVGVHFSPDGRTLYAHSQDPARGYTALQVIDVDTGLRSVDPAGWFSGMAVAFPPLAPDLSVTVAGRRVDLAWQDAVRSPAATSHLLEIGSVSGAADIAVVALGAARALTVPAAPPGRYFVRVRGVNATGQGPQSPDVVVTVP